MTTYSANKSAKHSPKSIPDCVLSYPWIWYPQGQIAATLMNEVTPLSQASLKDLKLFEEIDRELEPTKSYLSTMDSSLSCRPTCATSWRVIVILTSSPKPKKAKTNTDTKSSFVLHKFLNSRNTFWPKKSEATKTRCFANKKGRSVWFFNYRYRFIILISVVGHLGTKERSKFGNCGHLSTVKFYSDIYLRLRRRI